MLFPALPLSILNGHIVRREDSRSSLFTDPGTPDSLEVKLFHPFNQYFRQHSLLFQHVKFSYMFFYSHIKIKKQH